MTLLIYIWLAVLVVALIFEAMTTALVAVWFVPGAIVAMLLEAFRVPLPLQIIVFAFVSVLGIVFFSAKLRENINKNKTETNADAVIGKRAIVEVDILPDKVGRVKIMGQSWSALSSDNTPIAVGEAVKVLKIDGVKLICEPFDK